MIEKKTKNYESSIVKKIKKLEHHRDSTVGLWATDKPEKIPENIKHLFFEIKE